MGTWTTITIWQPVLENPVGIPEKRLLGLICGKVDKLWPWKSFGILLTIHVGQVNIYLKIKNFHTGTFRKKPKEKSFIFLSV